MKEKKWLKYVFLFVFLCVSIIGSCFFVHNLIAGFVFATAFLLVGLVPYEKVIGKFWRNEVSIPFVFLVSAFSSAFLSQFLLNENLFLLGTRRVFLEIAICLLLMLFFFMICLDYRISVIVALIFVVLLTTINYYVYLFKGNEFQPGDFFGIQTALNVIGGYRIVIAPTVFYAIVLCCIYIFFICQLPKAEVKRKNFARIIALMSCVLFIFLFEVISKPIHAQYFLRTGESANGYLLNFVLQAHSADVDAPVNYSKEKVEELSEKYSQQATQRSSSNYPDIIVIMDESFANLACLGSEVHTNVELTPYIDSLSENTIHGYALSSVFGGGTPNSEYEFLTGNSLAFLPEGTFVYSQYLKKSIPSMVSELNALGYRTIGMHPYWSTGWNRDIVYPLLGFDEIYFQDAFQGYGTIRNYISDQGMFEMITDYYADNKKNSEENLFIFGVTMQNHGGYQYSGENFEPLVELQDYSMATPEAEQYLTLLNKTDSAIQYLIEYFKEVDQDVVIVFFGDHYPRVGEEFYTEIHGGSFSTLEERQLRYEVPFFIWTNYQSKEQEVELTSLNYLSNYVYETANIPLPAYNCFLKDVQETIPAINSQGYYSLKKQCFLSLDEAASEDEDILNKYNILVYNSLFDVENLGAIFHQ